MHFWTLFLRHWKAKKIAQTQRPIFIVRWQSFFLFFSRKKFRNILKIFTILQPRNHIHYYIVLFSILFVLYFYIVWVYTPYALFFTVHFKNFDKKACTLKRYTVKNRSFSKNRQKKAKKSKWVKNKAHGVYLVILTKSIDWQKMIKKWSTVKKRGLFVKTYDFYF